MNIINLVKIHVLNTFGFNKAKNEKDKKNRLKEVTVLVSLIITFAVLVGSSFGYSFTLAKYAKNAIEVPQVIMGVASILILFIGIFIIRGTLIAFKDYDFQMSLPIKVTDIIISRLVILYVYSMFIILILVLPANICYGILVKESILFYILSLIALLFIPVIPIVVASALGIVLELLFSKVDNRKMWIILAGSVIVCGLFIGLFQASYGNMSTKDFSSVISKGGELYPLAKVYVDGVCRYNILSLVKLVILSIGTLLIFIRVLGKYFKAINTKLFTNKTKGDYKFSILKENTIRRSLLKKELKKYFSSSTYVFNTIFGMIAMVVGTISIMILGENKLIEMLGAELFNIVKNIIPLGISALVVTTVTSASAISMEGKSFWITKTLPVEGIDIINSIIEVNIIVTMPISLVCSFSMGILFKYNLVMFILAGIIPIIYCLFTATLGITINLLFPVLSWKSETEVIKQSISPLITVLFGGVLVLIPILLSIFSKGFSIVYILMFTFIIMCIITIMLYSFLLNRGDKLIYNIKN